MTFDLLSAVQATHFLVRQGPEHGVDTHEDRLYEDPCDIDRFHIDLPFAHVYVVLACIVAANSGL